MVSTTTSHQPFPLKYNGLLIHSQLDKSGLIEVIDHGELRSLHFGSDAIQSTLDIKHPERLQLRYTRNMMLALSLIQPRRVLCIGLGGGSMVHFLHHHFPELIIDVIEKRPAVIEIANKYFSLPQSPLITLHTGDALELLPKLDHQYDIIFIDAFHGRGIDNKLITPKFIAEMRSRLTEQGLLSCNLWFRQTALLAEAIQLFSQQFEQQCAVLLEPGQLNALLFTYRDSVTATQQKLIHAQAGLSALFDQEPLPKLSHIRWNLQWLQIRLKLLGFFMG